MFMSERRSRIFSPHCIWFVWQGFGSVCVEATGVASVRSYQNLPPFPTDPMPAGSKTDPSLAKDEPISDREE